MANLWNREVDQYWVDVYAGSFTSNSRAIRLSLKPSGDSPAHTVSLQFESSPPADFVDIGAEFSSIRMGMDRFDIIYHLLQTEKPLFLTAYEDAGPPPLRFAGLSSDAESTGEGFKDANAGSTFSFALPRLVES